MVGWANLDDYDFSNAIAVTMFWYDPLTGLISEIDMAFNNNTKFAWHVNDDSDEIWDYADTDAYDVDVRNIATHEAGHWLILGDMYNKPANEQTMYGISAEFELQKRSLESGDKAGIIEIYPSS
ncbi:matrixin family metalloprotease [Chloroflexota bacterium]